MKTAPGKRTVQMTAIARLRELPSPTFADALEMLCHCGERLNEHCPCSGNISPRRTE